MERYEFRLNFRVSIIPDMEVYDERLFDSDKMHDGFWGVGGDGILEIDFERESISARDAFAQTIGDVLEILPEAELLEAHPDLVSITEMAMHLGCSRQNMRKIIEKGRLNGFPAPRHHGASVIWSLSPVLEWLISDGRTGLSKLQQISLAAMEINVKCAIKALESTVAPRFEKSA